MNATFFFSQSASNSPASPAATAGLGVNPITVTNSKLETAVGPAVQFGFDYMIDRHWGLNFDVKKVWLQPDWEGTITTAGNVPLAATGKVRLDPWLIGGGVTYRF